mmetsp:Transcript_10834/g.24569  ORF Transcript_10834/g.24569 Transcript_10834/m.24569 type:complete len:245 (+) Transcript_10834:132-866(+)
MRHCGRETTVGVSACPSASWPENVAPWSSRPVRPHGSAAALKLALESQPQTSLSLSMDTPALRAVCCRRAIKKVAGRSNALRFTGLDKRAPEATASLQPSMATVLCCRSCNQRAGAGGPSQSSTHPSGGSPEIRACASCCTDDDSSSDPLSTLLIDSIEACTRRARECARAHSNWTKVVSGSRFSEPLSTGTSRSRPLAWLRVAHSVSKGCSCALHFSRSKAPEAASAADMACRLASTLALLVT